MNQTQTPPFAATAISEGTDLRLRLRGELDQAAAQFVSLVEVVEGACTDDHTALVTDVGELHYCDSSGIRALLEAAEYCARRGLTVRTVGARGIVRRVFEITAVIDALGVENDTR